MTQDEYIHQLGFQINPFQFTNADKEIEYLSQYFISPDYFEDLWGNPLTPVSNIIYAPRGGGKTAQRIMIEKRAQSLENLLTITYTNHDLTQFKSIDEINLSYHLIYLNRLLLLAFFSRLEAINIDYKLKFSFQERQFIYKLAKIYLFDTPASFPSQAINSLKTLQDKFVDVWINFKEPILNIVKQISKAKGVEVDLNNIVLDKKLQLSHKDNLFNLVVFLQRLGYESVYILIDKVDEQNLTGNNPEASYRLIADLIKDLELLETPRLSFKFFLWDALKPFAVQHARPDRVFSYNLVWSWTQIQEMLTRRIKTYSNGKIEDIEDLFSEKKYLGRIILFSQLSPRDCIRICNRIISEQYKEDPSSAVFQEDVINRSIEMFCQEKAMELITNSTNLKYLTKSNQVSFTIEELVSNKVAADSPAIRNIINPWTIAGYLKKIGLVPRRNAKAVNEYAFQDIRLAFIACPKLTIDEFINFKVRRCSMSTCKKIYYRDFDRKQYYCPECNTLN
jgi:hypothetical protein